jgi:uncharacterized damage-inducible protein DinB
MSRIAQTMLAEFEQEALTTRKFLDRVPADKLDWRPHPKSRTTGQLALHIAAAPGGVIEMANLDRAPAPDFSQGGPQPANLREVQEAFERSLELVRRILPALDDARMAQTWTAVAADGQPMLALPRVAFLRSILLNHWYHHRGQLGVYLRLLGAKVPASYGPSADEPPDFLAGK